MKLYYKPGACSHAPHIVARELGLPVEIDKVEGGRTQGGADYLAINPKGYVPALALDEGGLLTETQVILQYLADRKPEAQLLARPGTLERYRAQEWLAFIATELHKGFSPLFNKELPEAARQISTAALEKKLELVSRALEGKEFLLGDRFTVADAYLYTVLSWAKYVKLDLSRWPALNAYRQRIGVRPSVQAAAKAEGLLK